MRRAGGPAGQPRVAQPLSTTIASAGADLRVDLSNELAVSQPRTRVVTYAHDAPVPGWARLVLPMQAPCWHASYDGVARHRRSNDCISANRCAIFYINPSQDCRLRTNPYPFSDTDRR